MPRPGCPTGSLSPDDEEEAGSVGSCLHATGRSSNPAIHARVQWRSENMGQVPSATWFEATRRLWDDDVFQKARKRGGAPNDITLSNEIYPSRLIRDQRQASGTIESDVSRQAPGLEDPYRFEAVRAQDRYPPGRAEAK